MAFQLAPYSVPKGTDLTLSSVLDNIRQSFQQGKQQRYEDEAPAALATELPGLDQYGLNADSVRALLANPATRAEGIQAIRDATARRTEANDPLRQLQLKKAQYDIAHMGDVAPTRGIEINGKLVNPVTGQLMGDFSTPPKPDGPVTINDKLVDPSTGRVIGDYSDPTAPPNPVSINDKLVDPTTGRVIGDYASPAKPDLMTVSPGDNVIDKVTGKSIYSAPPKVDTPTLKDQFDQEEALRRDYAGKTDVKTYQDMRNSYQRIRASAAEDSGQGDLGIIYSFMKMLDPTSVVREGEFATAEQTSGVPTAIVNLYNRLLNGERLTNDQRKNFTKAAGALYKQTTSNLDKFNQQYAATAKRYGIDPSSFIVTPDTFADPTAGDIDSILQKYQVQ